MDGSRNRSLAGLLCMQWRDIIASCWLFRACKFMIMLSFNLRNPCNPSHLGLLGSTKPWGDHLHESNIGFNDDCCLAPTNMQCFYNWIECSSWQCKLSLVSAGLPCYPWLWRINVLHQFVLPDSSMSFEVNAWIRTVQSLHPQQLSLRSAGMHLLPWDPRRVAVMHHASVAVVDVDVWDTMKCRQLLFRPVKRAD